MHASLMQHTFEAVTKNAEAKAIYVYDFTKKQPLFGLNENTSLPLASLTKLMTIRMAAKSVSPNATYTIVKDDLLPDGSSTGFVVGDSYHVIDIMRAAIIASSNNAAVMLARSTKLSIDSFIQLMNYEAKNLGLESLSYKSPTGLDLDNTHASAFGSAQDTVSLLYRDYTDFPKIFSESTKDSVLIRSEAGRSTTLVNTNKAIPALALLVASKTGYTDIAGGNLAILWQEPGGDLIGASVLGSSQTGRFYDMVHVHNAAVLYLSGINSFPNVCK